MGQWWGGVWGVSATEYEMVRWHHQLKGHESEQTPGGSEGQGSLAVLQSMGSKRVRHNLATDPHAQPLMKGISPLVILQKKLW